MLDRVKNGSPYVAVKRLRLRSRTTGGIRKDLSVGRIHTRTHRTSRAFSLAWLLALALNIILRFTETISIGNSMICSDIWHKYHE